MEMLDRKRGLKVSMEESIPMASGGPMVGHVGNGDRGACAHMKGQGKAGGGMAPHSTLSTRIHGTPHYLGFSKGGREAQKGPEWSS